MTTTIEHQKEAPGAAPLVWVLETTASGVAPEVAHPKGVSEQAFWVEALEVFLLEEARVLDLSPLWELGDPNLNG